MSANESQTVLDLQLARLPPCLRLGSLSLIQVLLALLALLESLQRSHQLLCGSLLLARRLQESDSCRLVGESNFLLALLDQCSVSATQVCACACASVCGCQ